MAAKTTYGILPPLSTGNTGPGGPVATVVLPGCSVEEWRTNLARAAEEVMAALSPAQRAAAERDLRAVRCRKRRGRRRG